MANRLRDFQVQEFFRSLENVLLSSYDDNQASFNSAEFRTRRLDELERTLSVLLRIISQAYPGEHQLLADLTTLLNIVQERRDYFQSLSFRNVLEEENPNAQPLFMIGYVRSGEGRPRYITGYVTTYITGYVTSSPCWSWVSLGRYCSKPWCVGKNADATSTRISDVRHGS